MSRSWIKAKKDEFARDVIRDFCLVADLLEKEFEAFQATTEITFETMRHLLGEENNKGLLWRLKDTAHHLFRSEPDDFLSAHLLDWCIGYIFHECIKLKEDAYQRRNYGPWFRRLEETDLDREERHVVRELHKVIGQTRESMEREIKRIRFIMFHCRDLLPVYLHRYRGNALLARFLFDQKDLVRKVFRNKYDELIATVYGDEPELLYILAAQSLRQGGWMQDVVSALEQADALAPQSDMVQREKVMASKWLQRLRILS